MQELTLIDLPGITHSQAKGAGQLDNVPEVTQRIVRRYMEGKWGSSCAAVHVHLAHAMRARCVQELATSPCI